MTGLACLSLSGCRVSLQVLESLSFAGDDLGEALLDLRRRAGADQLCLLSTCERTELYATWTGEPDTGSLVRALAGSRRVPVELVQEASDRFVGPASVRHLMRVTAGLESFVLGERDIVGQVRSAALACHDSRVGGLELERLLAAAVNTSRRVHRSTRLGEGGRSVAAAAVQRAATENGGDLDQRRVLVVGAGQVAAEVVESATRLGAAVTVCNRTKRRADRFLAAGACIVDLGQLRDALSSADVAVFGTAAPHRLLDAATLAGLPRDRAEDLVVVDLCVPRNVDPAVRTLPGVRLLDLADLRATAGLSGDLVTDDLATAERIVQEEVERYLRWLAGRVAAASVRRLREEIETCVSDEIERIAESLPEELRPLMTEGVRRTVNRLAHGPTRRLLDAAESGNDEVVELLAGIFSAPAALERSS
ncbi:MAG: glutamyl-tRNA reductase [Nocardioidaceae bacterium]|jgi:glutamyl-tRNA reductase|nr:glutamyl-tRNA reductase [Nocardioidaceae bacterium]